MTTLGTVVKRPAEVKHRVIDCASWLCDGEKIKDAEAYPLSSYEASIVFPDLDQAKLQETKLRVFAEPIAGETDKVGVVFSNGITGVDTTTTIIFETSDGRREESDILVQVRATED